jgi:ribosomal protein L32E
MECGWNLKRRQSRWRQPRTAEEKTKRFDKEAKQMVAITGSREEDKAVFQ